MRVPVTGQQVTAAGRATAWAMTLGFALIQLAWIVSVPPYRGIDEFDHVYRAAAVARGEWTAPPSDATRGTGALVTVPEDIVRAANPVCETYPYTTDADCTPQEQVGGGTVTVASGAGRYNPAFYGVVGTAALPFDGYAALYAMRVATAALCVALFALAVGCTNLWRRSAWPLVGLLVASTPVAVYSTAIVAPNGVEIAAAMATWCALIGVVSRDVSPASRRRLLWAASGAAVVLVTVRSLGPFWLAAIVASVALLAPWKDSGWRRQLHPRRVWAPVVAVVAAGVGSAAWIITQRSLVIGIEESDAEATTAESLVAALEKVILWVLQAEAAFPTRSERAPVVVYASGLLLLAALLGYAALRGSRRETVVAWSVAVVSLAIPVAITTATFNDYGLAWQGRYGLPLAMGLPLLACLALDRARRGTTPVGLRLVVPAAAMWGVAHGVGVLNVLHGESRDSPLAETSAWWSPPLVAVGLIIVLACASWTVALVRSDRTLPGRSGGIRRQDPVLEGAS